MTTQPDQPARDEVRQLLVHPAVWPHLELWLACLGIELGRVPLDDDVPTYAMTPTDAAIAAAARPDDTKDA